MSGFRYYSTQYILLIYILSKHKSTSLQAKVPKIAIYCMLSAPEFSMSYYTKYFVFRLCSLNFHSSSVLLGFGCVLCRLSALDHYVNFFSCTKIFTKAYKGSVNTVIYAPIFHEMDLDWWLYVFIP